MNTQADCNAREWSQPYRGTSGLGETGLRGPMRVLFLVLAMFACPGLAAEPPAEMEPTASGRPAEPEAAPEPVPSAVDGASSKPSPVLRDPTQPSEQMRAVLGQGRTAPGPGLQPKLPAMRIKGRVASSDGHILVLLQVGQQLERVSAETQWTTDDGLTLSVVSLSLTELQLQIQPLNRSVTLR